MQNGDKAFALLLSSVLRSAFFILHSRVALSRGFAPRTSAFAERRAELITP